MKKIYSWSRIIPYLLLLRHGSHYCDHFEAMQIIFAQRSVRHGVSDDVDTHWKGALYRESFKKLSVFAFPLPAIAQVVIVTKQNHHSVVFVEQSVEMRRMVALGASNWMVGKTLLPEMDCCRLGEFLEVINVVKNLVA